MGELLELLALSGELLCYVDASTTTTVGKAKMLIHLAIGIEPFWHQLISVMGAILGDDSAILGPGLFACAVPTLMLVKLDPVGAAFQHEKQIVLDNVRAGKSLNTLDEKYRRDKDVVLAAVKLNVCQLQHALPEVTGDIDAMLDCLCAHPVARCYVAPELWLQREFVYRAVQLDGLLLEDAPTFKDDFEVVLAAARNNGYALRHAGFLARANKEIVLAAAQQQGCCICHASDALRRDREVALAAVRCKRMAMVHVRGGLQKDPEVLQLVADARHTDMLKHQAEASESIDNRSLVTA